MVNIVLTLAGIWILKHRADSKMPLVCLKEFLIGKYGDNFKVTRETYSILECSIAPSIALEDIRAAASDFLKKNYGDFENDFLAVTGEHDTTQQFADLFASKQRDIKGDGLQSYAAKGDSGVDSKSTKATPTHGGGERADGDSNNDIAKKLLDRINKLIGGEEFKHLAAEVALVAHQVLKNKTQDVFIQQSYLFSINEGCGYDKYLGLFAELIGALNLHDTSAKNTKFFTLEMQRPNSEDVRIKLLSDIENCMQKSMVCIDISDWMNDVKGTDFNNFLKKLRADNPSTIFAFRIPYVSPEVMDNIGKALNDVMFIRKVACPPFTTEEIGKFADMELAHYGFSMQDKAWNGFFTRIREESSDGKFYGIDTISKVVQELIYSKQLDNATRGVSDMVIGAADTEKLCKTAFMDDKTGMEMLESMVGTESIKTRVLEIISQIELVRQNPTMGSPSLHMRFVGNPGTGKTTIARIIGKILKEKGILRIGEFHEHSGRDFCGKYIGETAPKTISLCREAYGSVLFVDEAYSLFRGDKNSRDYGLEALDTLIAEMENHRSDFVVIMAGYTDEMNVLVQGNAGLASRMPYTIEFPNFSKQQLFDIFMSMCKGKIKCDEDMLAEAKDYFLGLPDAFVSAKEFSNARFVRNLYERVCAKAAMRCQLSGIKEIVLKKEDFTRSIADKEFSVNDNRRRKIGFGD